MPSPPRSRPPADPSRVNRFQPSQAYLARTGQLPTTLPVARADTPPRPPVRSAEGERRAEGGERRMEESRDARAAGAGPRYGVRQEAPATHEKPDVVMAEPQPDDSARPVPPLPAASTEGTSETPYILVVLDDETSDGDDSGVLQELLRGRASVEVPRQQLVEICDTSLDQGSVTSGREHEEEEGDNEEGEVYVYDSDEHDDEGLFVFADTTGEDNTAIGSDDEEGISTGRHVDEQHLRKRRKVSTGQDSSFEMEGGRRTSHETASHSNAPSTLARRPDSPILLRTVADPRANSSSNQVPSTTSHGDNMPFSDPRAQSGSSSVPSDPRSHSGSTVASTSHLPSHPDRRESLPLSNRLTSLTGPDAGSAIPMARVASTGALDSPSSTSGVRPPTVAKASYQRRTTSTPASTSTDKPAIAPAAPLSTSNTASKAAYVRREGAAGKAMYSRPPGGALGTASTSASATVSRREKAPGALPLSAEEKQATFPGKLASTFPLQFATLEAATSPHLFVPPPLIIAMVSSFTGVRDPKIPSKGPIEGVLHGFWPAPPPLQVGRALWPPLKVIQGAPVFAKPEDDKRPRVDIIVDHSNILYSFLNWARARPEAVIKDFVGESNGKIRTSKTVTLSGKKVKLDYSVLFTILERGRKVDRRILAGSSPLWQSLEDATDWGYEVSVLQRVPRVILPPPAPLGNRPSIAPVIDPYTNEPTGAIQAKVVVPPPKRKSVGGSAIGNGGSGLQGADGEKEERAFKEQAVDELLHLKILESLLDHTPPSPVSPLGRPVLVLATGDANASEYNPRGFLGCAKMALERGWDVEIIAFASGISATWMAEQVAAAGNVGGRGRLSIVDLEVFAEELAASLGP